MLKKIRRLKNDRNFGEILTGSVLSLGAKILATGVTLMINVLIARYYGAEAMGVLAIVNAILLLVTIVTLFGTNTSILRFIPEQITKNSASSAYWLYRKVTWMVSGASIVSSIILFAASGLIARYVFDKPNLQGVIALTAGFIILKSLSDLTTQALRGLRLQKAFAFIQTVPSLSMLIILLWVMTFRKKPDDPIFAQLLSFALAALVGLVLVRKFFKEKMHADDVVVTPTSKEIASISLPMMISSSMGFLLGQSGVIILGIFRPEAEAGVYSIAVKLATLTLFVLQAINSMAAPKFSELYHQGKTDALFDVARKSSKLIFWTTAPILVVLLLFGKGILVLAFGEDFVAAYAPMTLLVTGQFINSISGSTGFFMTMTGEQKMYGRIMVVTAIANVIMTYLLVPQFGLMGAAFSTMISVSSWNIFVLAYIHKKHGRTISYLPFVS